MGVRARARGEGKGRALERGVDNGTFSMMVSKPAVFLVLASSTISRKETRSRLHSVTSVRAWMLAVRGQLYIKASSPNMSPAAKVLTNCCRSGSARVAVAAPEEVTKASSSPAPTT